MPELPEVETARRGIEPHIDRQTVRDVVVRNPKLRWPVPENLSEILRQQTVQSVDRRAKYILIRFDRGTLIVHLGMSGSVRIVDPNVPPQKHDHFDIVFGNGRILRLRDPRRFGCVLWSNTSASDHALIKTLGPEPLSDAFEQEYLFSKLSGRSSNIKSVIMNNEIVVGVGNIYASESLFRSAIRPTRRANRISRNEARLLVESIKFILKQAIEAGGTTLRDFVDSSGNPGYFEQKLMVYGRDGEACYVCGRPIKSKRIAQRNTFFCSNCQK